IRDRNVTGVQTCALPIFGYSADYILNSKSRGNSPTEKPETEQALLSQITTSEELFSEVASSEEKICLTNTRAVSQLPDGYTAIRSEERRVGKERIQREEQ